MNKAGRNDPCPCGSGKKFKHCCQHRQSGAVHAVKSTTMNAPIQQSLQMAVEHHRAGRLHHAEAVYRQILQAAPNQPDALHLLGMVANQMGRNNIAADLIGKAISIHPVSPMYYNLGNVFREQGKLDAAVENFQMALKLDPGYANAYLNMGAVLNEQGKLDAAAENFRKTLKLKPDFAEAHFHLGNVCHAQGKLDAAAECFRKVLILKPGYAEAHINLGNVLKDQGRLEEAIYTFRKVLSLKPDFAEAHNNLGNTLQIQGKPGEAIESFRQALSLKPDFVEANNNLGNVLKDQGRLDEAIESFRKALSFNPDFAEAHGNLGNALRDQGKLEEAIACYRQALALNPNFADAYVNQGNTLQEQCKLDEAVESFRKALALKPDFAEAHGNLGNALRDQGKLEGAITCYRQALALKPDFAEVHNNLGIVLQDQGKLEEAIACYRQALALNPDFADAYVNRGIAFQEQDRLDEAIESFHKALALEPDFAEAHIRLGYVCQDTGQFSVSKDHFDQALALKPNHPLACAALPSLRKMTPDDMHWAEKAQALLKDRLKAQDEIKLCYALGKFYDDTCQYDAAFTCFERAHRLKQQSARPFDRDIFRRLVDDIISAHAPEAVWQQQTGSSASRRPVFVVGMPRSGTSLTEQILASHPDVFGAGELRFWWKQATAHQSAMRSWCRNAHLLQNLANQCETELLRHSATALRVVDKMPSNFLYLGLIHAVFPHARILHMQRNPVDTCLSIYFQDFSRAHEYANDLGDLAFYYREYHRLMAHWRNTLPAEVFLDVPYEALVDDQEGWSRKIIGFIGLEWADQCRDFHKTERRVGTVSNWQVRQKIFKTSKERWRNYGKFMGSLLPLLELPGN